MVVDFHFNFYKILNTLLWERPFLLLGLKEKSNLFIALNWSFVSKLKIKAKHPGEIHHFRHFFSASIDMWRELASMEDSWSGNPEDKATIANIKAISLISTPRGCNWCQDWHSSCMFVQQHLVSEEIFKDKQWSHNLENGQISKASNCNKLDWRLHSHPKCAINCSISSISVYNTC